ncbi:uncharacterized protein P174DRAFT_425308 [Aspergillus novofumigatus IBT 16806]|uniref:Uncharacterized protein n=1 Tax=Aspergillus novofumigatus (strain IBT 16806) TaxID=1392255 RepID=A0A2I1BVI9_ASPN1|nr:uncharacterized protein P174DRAFT_425308 [Aspergillus novofumigatus IBT 16806]PKX89384.1 hypothetical protein P174DRAFT_425308 [Aspergillus novofumigatus IBT 16806]
MVTNHSQPWESWHTPFDGVERRILSASDAADKGAIHGLALSARGLRETDTYDDHLSGPIWTNTWHPCSNCKELTENTGGSVANFNKYNGRQGAPGYHYPN